MNHIQPHLEAIKELCQLHNVAKLYVFGSAVKGTFTTSSDIDLVVDFKEINLKDYADNYFNLKEELELVLDRKIDLLEEQGIRNPFLRTQIDKEKELIYG
jgi:predicted nucleotidyltransferase